MTQRDEVQKFEHGRIKVLQEERLHIQKKTFTKWMNSFLQKARMEVDDLFVDLADGRKLLKLLEIISGEKLGKPNAGKMRVHKIENVNKSLAFLHTKVRLESIGAEDIVDGNPRLILGLIWTIILRFQIQEIEIDVDEENETSEKKSAKDALLLWAQRKTHGYNHVHIHDFTNSWRSGLGFNALIHSHRPDLFDYNQLQPQRHIDNLNHAFDVANNELGIPRLLDAEDIDTNRPDEKSIMTYVASYYHTFARMKNEAKSGRRIEKIIKQMSDADQMKLRYDVITTDLLEWIQKNIVLLEDREFPNSLEGIQRLLINFGHYRTREKPPKYKERSEIEALFFNINMQLKELRQPTFLPTDGKLLQDIERAWDRLERAEHRRELALRSELRRQERLEQINDKFEKKSILRENYLKEMIQVLSDPIYGSNLAKVDATVKKHEAISADILAREGRIHDLTQMSEELVREGYRNSNRVKEKSNEVLDKWQKVLDLVEKHKKNLGRMGNVMSLLREIDTTLDAIYQLETDFSSVDIGIHLMAVEELLQKHALQELQVNSLGETERRLQRLGEQNASTQTPKEEAILRKKMAELSQSYKSLQDACSNRKLLLEDARNFYQFLQDQEDEEAWLIEKQRICLAEIIAKDLRAVLHLQQKHKLLLDEIKNRKSKFVQLSNLAQKMISEKHPRAEEIEQHLQTNQKEWAKLEDLASERTKRLHDAAEAYQFYADANEADSYLNEKKSILASKDYGSDEPSAQALLQRHRDLQGELNAYSGDIQSLNNQAERLISAGISNLNLTPETEVSEPIEETVYENKMVPVEVYEEEPVEKIVPRVVLQERKVPQVRALFAFNDHGLSMAKGEVMFLLNQTNPDWWCVRKADGTDGFAPANYVEEIEPRVIQMKVSKPEKVKVMQKVKKTKMILQKVPVKVLKAPRQLKRKVDDSNSVPKRQKNINDTYKECQEMASKRNALLADAIRLYGFYKECDDFDKWIKDKEKMLTTDDPKETVEQARRKHKKFVTDLSASSRRLEGIDAEVKEFERQRHSQIDKVRGRHRQITAAFDRLNKLRTQKEKSLEGAGIVEIFLSNCDEAKERMHEKLSYLDSEVLGLDLKTVQALQRRHEQLEREITPIEQTVNEINLLANSVVTSNPNEHQNVSRKLGEIKSLWGKVKERALNRRARLEDAVGQQIFTNSSQTLLGWVADVKNELNTDVTVRDVQTAEKCLKSHYDLNEDIKAHADEFRQITDLGRKLLKSNPNLKDVAEKIERLTEEQAALQRGWKEKENWLQQCLLLQKFNKEADKIDAATSSHQSFLEFSDLGNSLDEVEALLKQHRAFANTLIAQEAAVNQFDKKADNLIAQKHYESQGIDKKRREVLQRRNAVKALLQNRSNALEASKNYQEFCAEVHDLKVWLSEKLKTASDESYRDLSNLERKLQKHEAFERELRANEGQLRTVNKMGQALIADEGSYRKDKVANNLKELNDEWQKLVGISLDKGKKLRQAQMQHNYNASIDDVNSKLIEIESKLSTKDVGLDMRSCKDLLKKQDIIENELTQCSIRVNELANQSKDMSHDGHFDSDSVVNGALLCQKKLKSLDAPARQRRSLLDEAQKFHKFNFDLDNELQWIKEHMPQASTKVLGQNLHQAQNLYKKHKKLEDEISGHKVVIDKTLEIGQTLINQKHPEHKKISDLSDTLKAAYSELNHCAAERTTNLEQSLKAQEYFFETNEVESWLNEKKDILASTDYGRDRNAATKLLTKHKALELELDTYSSIINEMGRGAQTLVQSKHPESKSIAERQTTLELLVRSLQRKAVIRQQRLMESLFRHEYFLESNGLERWIQEQYQQASSEDYGQDYEHLLLLQAKFDDFKLKIDAASDRFKQCEDLAQKLIANDSPYIADIENEQFQLEESWTKLLAQIENRDKKLQAASEVHRFHRDIADALSRIHEKAATLGNELGRDLNAALSLVRKQEAFENELVVLEAQLQVLIDDAAKLKAQYPANKESVQNKQDAILLAWQNLKDATEARRDQLQANVDLQKFIAEVRDLTTWSEEVRRTIDADENVRSAARAQALKDEHEALRGEIEAREERFLNVREMATCMDQTDHYAANEAVEKCNSLFAERQKLHTAWTKKKVYLDQLIDLHIILRDAKQLENICNTQEAALSNSDFGETVEEVLKQVRKHEEFDKVLQSQDEKFDALLITGDKLISQRHFDSDNIAKRLRDVKNKRIRVKQISVAKKHQLEHALLYTVFARDVADAKAWILDKLKKLESEDKSNVEAVTNLEEKIKKLQKHQAFEAECAANLSRMSEIKDKGEKLIVQKHRASEDIQKQLNELNSMWRKLEMKVIQRGRGLEEAQEILEFNNQLDKIESWIRDKEVMVQAADTGRDFEHCQALQRKLDDVDSDMRIDDSRVHAINILADKLIKQDHKGVKERRDNFLGKWQYLQGALNDYREKLAGAVEVHTFNRDVSDTLQRITDKITAMEVDDIDKDLAGVELLQRKQEAAEIEMTAVQKKLHEHDHVAHKLLQKYPENSEIATKVHELQTQWNKLQTVKERRRRALSNAYIKHKFLSNTRDLEIWCAEIIKRMESRGKPASVSEADAMLEHHVEFKAEMDGRKEDFNQQIHFGNQLNKDDPQITEAVQQLQHMHDNLYSTWNKYQKILAHECDLQAFHEQADMIDNWLASKEAFLNNEDIGDNLRAVEILINKHKDFEATLNQQLIRVDELKESAKRLEVNNYDNTTVLNRVQTIMQRTDNLVKSTMNRKAKLEDSKPLHEFIRIIHEIENWLIQKLQIASDDNYRDPTNLQSKIQKHIAFDAEIVANTNRIRNVILKGQNLIDKSHFAAEDIEKRLDDVDTEWKNLQELSVLKKQRLNDAYQALLYNRTLDEFENWLGEVQNQLQSTDVGKDMVSVNILLKKHTSLENDVKQHAENCEIIHENCETFVKNNHFMADELKERAQDIITRYHKLEEPLQARRDALEASMMFHQFSREIDDELEWLADREPGASSRDLGMSLTSVQLLQKKHQALESELMSREVIINGLISRGAQLTRSGHSLSNLIADKAAEVKTKFASIKDTASLRRLRLQDALEAQMYYTEVSEAEAWIADKKSLLDSSEIGRDEDSTQSLQRKLEAFHYEISTFSAVIKKIDQSAQKLIERNHFDSKNISKKLDDLKDEFIHLQNLLTDREKRLSEALLYFGFIRKCSEIQEWMSDQQTKAASEDYGTDVEHVELLTQAFETFYTSLLNNEGKILECIETGQKLIDAKSRHLENVSSKMEEVQIMWEDLTELASARKDALYGAKQVHTFDRIADETISWIQEKDAALAIDNYGNDLESIQAFVRKHDAFERELEAIKEKVTYVVNEAKKLIETYPDTEEHINAKRDDTLAAWAELQEKSEMRRTNLKQSEHLQTYYDQHQELLAWINEMLAKITAPDLPQDVTNAEVLIERHKEHKVEIDARSDVLNRLIADGHKFIKNGHIFSADIDNKLRTLEARLDLLKRTWTNRNSIYEQNLDVQLFKREANTLENWIVVREPTLKDDKMGDSIAQVEDQIKKHEDFENTVKAQEEKFVSLKRMTLLEDAFAMQKQMEAEARRAERERQEHERIAQRKMREMQRITESRRLEGGGKLPMEINGNQENSSVQGSSITKSNSVAHIFGNRIRRGSDGSIKRAESMKVQGMGGTKLPKRTPSFTTRRRGSFRTKNTIDENELPPVEIQGFIDRKQVLIAGGKKAPNRNWKTLFTVMCGQLLCFFKNREDFAAAKALYAPLGIHNAKCTVADDYSKKKHTFRLIMVDQSEYLFSCNSAQDMNSWVNKISFRAKLPPSLQLVNFEVQKPQQEFHDVELSSQSSRTSSPDVTDTVTLRHDPQYSNGSTHHRNTISGESPPPLPGSQPPNVTGGRRHNSIDGSGENNDWSSSRSSPTSQTGEKRSSRIMDLFRKRRQPSSHM